MEQHHHHHHADDVSVNTAFKIGLWLNIVFVIIEFLSGLYAGSLGLISDAGHNLSDVFSLMITMFAFYLARKPATHAFTYGYRRSTIQVSLINVVILFVAVVFIVIECVGKLLHPQPVEGVTVICVAAAGVVVNGVTTWLLMKGKKKDLNIKGAYLHMLADTLVSIGVVVSGVIISFTGWYLLDPIIGLAVAVIIVMSGMGLLRDSVRLSLDGVPESIDYSDVVDVMKSVEGVCDVHHVHIWALSTTDNALTAHVVVAQEDNMNQLEDIKLIIKEKLAAKGLQHVTLEMESAGSGCDCKCCLDEHKE